MRKTVKIWLITAASLVLIGCIIFGGVMTMLKWDFTKLSTVKYETNDYEISETFKAISVTTNTADIRFVPSADSKCSVVCHEEKNIKHSVAVKNDTLVIEVDDTRKWYEHIGINFSTPKITVSLPQGDYGMLSVKANTGFVEISENFKFEGINISTSTGDVKNAASSSGPVKIKTSTGRISIESISAEALDLAVSTGKVTVSDVSCTGDVKVSVSTGKVNLTDITCKNLLSSGDTGDLSLKNVIASENFSIERDTGDVRLDGCDAAEILIETDTGDVTGTLLSDKIFMAKSDTGHVNVPETTTGGKCKITTDTGDVRIDVVSK